MRLLEKISIGLFGMAVYLTKDHLSLAYSLYAGSYGAAVISNFPVLKKYYLIAHSQPDFIKKRSPEIEQLERETEESERKIISRFRQISDKEKRLALKKGRQKFEAWLREYKEQERQEELAQKAVFNQKQQ